MCLAIGIGLFRANIFSVDLPSSVRIHEPILFRTEIARVGPLKWFEQSIVMLSKLPGFDSPASLGRKISGMRKYLLNWSRNAIRRKSNYVYLPNNSKIPATIASMARTIPMYGIGILTMLNTPVKISHIPSNCIPNFFDPIIIHTSLSFSIKRQAYCKRLFLSAVIYEKD